MALVTEENTMRTLTSIDTPAAVIDITKMQRNIIRMQSHLDTLGVQFRPHVKTSKCLRVAQAQQQAGAHGITVSTLKEADYFFENGYRNQLYAVGIAPHKLEHITTLRQKGCDLKIITDSVASATSIAQYIQKTKQPLEVRIEIDSDGHRSGIQPEQQDVLLTVAHTLHNSGAIVGGVMTHAGSSYELNTPETLQKMAEQERAACVKAAERIRADHLPCPVVSIGSTPTALSAQHLEDVTEVRAGVYVFFDLVMHNVGVCQMNEIALSVLTTIISHQPEKGWIITDAGWMAMSRDHGTQKQDIDYGYGQVCTVDGKPMQGWIMSSANQEHGIISRTDSSHHNIERLFPIGTRLRILPNHACATGAQFPEYQALSSDNTLEIWPRIYGW